MIPRGAGPDFQGSWRAYRRRAGGHRGRMRARRNARDRVSRSRGRWYGRAAASATRVGRGRIGGLAGTRAPEGRARPRPPGSVMRSWCRGGRGVGAVVVSGRSWCRGGRGVGAVVVSGRSWCRGGRGVGAVVVSGRSWCRGGRGVGAELGTSAALPARTRAWRPLPPADTHRELRLWQPADGPLRITAGRNTESGAVRVRGLLVLAVVVAEHPLPSAKPRPWRPRVSAALMTRASGDASHPAGPRKNLPSGYRSGPQGSTGPNAASQGRAAGSLRSRRPALGSARIPDGEAHTAARIISAGDKTGTYARIDPGTDDPGAGPGS